MKTLLACFKILRLQGELSDKSLSPVEVWKQPLLWNSYSNPAITAWFAMAGEIFEPHQVIPPMAASCQ